MTQTEVAERIEAIKRDSTDGQRRAVHLDDDDGSQYVYDDTG
jgi:hypothetical protein